MQKRPWTRTNTVCLTCSIITILAFLIVMAWINHRFPDTQTPAERREQFRQQQLEDARAKNYVERIKPHVPGAP